MCCFPDTLFSTKLGPIKGAKKLNGSVGPFLLAEAMSR